MAKRSGERGVLDPAGPVRVLIAEDDIRFAQALQDVLGEDARIVVVGSATSAAEVVDLALAATPDVVLLDLRMPEAAGIDTLGRLLAAQPEIRVIVLSGDSSTEITREAIEAGASAYLLKGGLHNELVEKIVDVAHAER